MMPTTPSGSRVTSTSTPGRTESSLSPRMRTASPAKYLKIAPGARRFADAVGERLSLLARQQPPELFLARQNLGAGAIEDVEAFLRRRQRPFGERALRRRYGLLDVSRRPARELADDVADVRGIDIRGTVGRLDGLAVDEVRERGGHGRYHFSRGMSWQADQRNFRVSSSAPHDAGPRTFVTSPQ